MRGRVRQHSGGPPRVAAVASALRACLNGAGDAEDAGNARDAGEGVPAASIVTNKTS